MTFVPHFLRVTGSPSGTDAVVRKRSRSPLMCPQAGAERELKPETTLLIPDTDQSS